jgi:homoserine dehydrogenase
MQPLNPSSPPFDIRRPGQSICVIKFGSSLLGTIADVPAICAEIGRHVSASRKVVAVISAFKGETDHLFEQAGRLAAEPCRKLLPRFILSGEERAASLIALGCAARELSTELVPISGLGFVATGNPLSSTPRSLDPWPITQALANHDVVVVPGFGAHCAASGKPVLLGRGGGDLSAAMIAGALKLARFRLVKDVDGIYSSDPKQGPASRFSRLDWEQARRLAAKIVQREAIDCAERLNLSIEVAAPGSDDPSVVGPRQPEAYCHG